MIDNETPGKHRARRSGWPKARRLGLALAATTAVAGTGMVLSAVGASASTPQATHKITICHRTDAMNNPYRQISVDLAGAYGHWTEHQGTVWTPTHPKEPKWGDIIPTSSSTPPPSSSSASSSAESSSSSASSSAESSSASSSAESSSASSSAESSSASSSAESSSASSSAESSSASSAAESSSASSPVTVSDPPSSESSSGASGVDGSSASQTSAAAGVDAESTSRGNGGAAAAAANGPIPAAANAGLHTPLGPSGLEVWGAVLMLLGGLGGVAIGAWPNRKRAH